MQKGRFSKNGNRIIYRRKSGGPKAGRCPAGKKGGVMHLQKIKF